uniref:Beta-defensin-like domain-containing protein n=1 Tax=Zonotrichia albicollis TaxID=44394 RepID=A0A8D2QGD9_ZONAL
MRILHVLLTVLFLMLQGAAGQVFPRPDNSCLIQNGRCFPGICRRPYYWIGTCSNGYSCCRMSVVQRNW